MLKEKLNDALISAAFHLFERFFRKKTTPQTQILIGLAPMITLIFK